LLQSRLLKHRFLESLLTDHPQIGQAEPGRIYCEALPQLRRVVCLDEPSGTLESWDAFLKRGEAVTDALIDALSAQVHPSDDCVIVYTSGTTAMPKGVLHGHRAPALQGRRIADLIMIDERDRLFTSYPFFWTAGMAMSLMAPLYSGATIVLTEAFEPSAALDQIRKVYMQKRLE
jgi:acyl-coenzyme A synthetase/AMP-(fatty) acid ligase